MYQDKEYLYVKEFAKIVGTSPQAIYQRLGTSLKPYTSIVKGKKVINSKALIELYNISLEQDFKQEIKGSGNDVTIELLQKNLEFLQNQIEQKDKQLEQKDKLLDELSKALDQQQKLNAMDKQRILELEEKSTPTKKSRWNFFRKSDII